MEDKILTFKANGEQISRLQEAMDKYKLSRSLIIRQAVDKYLDELLYGKYYVPQSLLLLREVKEDD